MAGFETVSDDTIKKGYCTDIYFVRTEETLRLAKINPVVSMEVTASALPDEWAVFCGLSDVIALLEGIPVTVDAMPEGSIFLKNEPVVRISGSTGIFAGTKQRSSDSSAMLQVLPLLLPISYSPLTVVPSIPLVRARQHPSIARMIERAAWIGGVDGVSNICAPEGMPVVGTMPHAFVMCYKKPEDAWRSFDKNTPKEVPRIMLCDTYCDEKTESLRAAECGATAVRLDTPRSRRGNMRSIIEEVRWELDAHGYPEVKIFLSGGVTREDIILYKDIVDAFGVGGAIANAPVIDFGMDIVEIEGIPKAKRGKRSGVKQVYSMPDGSHRMVPVKQKAPMGGKILIEPFIQNGKKVMKCDMQEARKRVLQKLPALSSE